MQKKKKMNRWAKPKPSLFTCIRDLCNDVYSSNITICECDAANQFVTTLFISKFGALKCLPISAADDADRRTSFGSSWRSTIVYMLQSLDLPWWRTKQSTLDVVCLPLFFYSLHICHVLILIVQSSYVEKSTNQLPSSISCCSFSNQEYLLVARRLCAGRHVALCHYACLGVLICM